MPPIRSTLPHLHISVPLSTGQTHLAFPRFHALFKPHTISAARLFSTKALDARKGDRERVVILGSGWAGFVLSRNLSPKKFQTVVISPRSHFVFTPLLAGSAVGSQEFRTILEPVRDRKLPNVELVQAWADDVDFERRVVRVESSVLTTGDTDVAKTMLVKPSSPQAEMSSEPSFLGKGKMWDINYDKLVIAVGCYSHTFGTKGVKENAFFLKDVSDARKIRTRVLECFEIAALPTTSPELKKQLLHFAVVGGGPTGMEFSAELRDLVYQDMIRLYPDVKEFVKVTVYDVADKVLSMFDRSLSEYAADVFRRQNIDIRTGHHVEELRLGLPSREDGSTVPIEDTAGCYTIKTKEDGEVGVGLCGKYYICRNIITVSPNLNSMEYRQHDEPIHTQSRTNTSQSPTKIQFHPDNLKPPTINRLDHQEKHTNRRHLRRLQTPPPPPPSPLLPHPISRSHPHRHPPLRLRIGR